MLNSVLWPCMGAHCFLFFCLHTCTLSKPIPIRGPQPQGYLTGARTPTEVSYLFQAVCIFSMMAAGHLLWRLTLFGLLPSLGMCRVRRKRRESETEQKYIVSNLLSVLPRALLNLIYHNWAEGFQVCFFPLARPSSDKTEGVVGREVEGTSL